jgi:thioredoxin reductase (NADPH)
MVINTNLYTDLKRGHFFVDKLDTIDDYISNMSKHKIAIIGSGPSGLTAAIYTSRASIETQVFMGNQPGGQLTTTTEIENFPGFIDGIMGPELMTNMEEQAKRFGAVMSMEEVSNIKVQKGENNKFVVVTGSGDHEFDAVIVASGASSKYLGLEGEEAWVGKGYHTCATCDGFFYRGKTICVVGGGDSAMEEANFLTKFATKVYLIHRSDNYRASKIMLDRAKANPKIEFMPYESIIEFITEGKDFKGVKIQNQKDQTIKDLTLDGVFVAIGHNPNSQFTTELNLAKDEIGYLIPQAMVNPEDRVSQFSTGTSVEGLFVAGDVEDKVYRQAITAAGNGCKAAIDAERYLESL